MKKIIILVGLIGVTIITSQSKLFTRIVNSSEPELLPTMVPHTSVLGIQNVTELTIDGQKVNAVWYEVSDTTKLKLIPNFKDKQTAKFVKEKNNCKFLINGGFYRTDSNGNNLPIGLFIENGNEFSSFKKSSLANGVISINDFATPRITDQVPQDHLDMALQNGPLLIVNSNNQKLSIRNDEQKRRVVVGVTGENKIVFVVFYSDQSSFIGPKLAKLPEAITKFEDKTGIVMADAMNLDGGTASTFMMDNFSLSEASIVGSFFCQQ